MQENFELSNADGLDESISNAIGIDRNTGYVIYSDFCCGADGENYSNFKVTPEQAKQAADLAGKGLQAIKGLKNPKTEFETQLKAVCGRKPVGIFNLGKKGKQRIRKYEECAAKFNAQKNAPAPSAPAPAPTPSAPTERMAAPQEEKPKFLGMPKAVGITVAVVGGLALLVGSFFLIKKMSKK